MEAYEKFHFIICLRLINLNHCKNVFLINWIMLNIVLMTFLYKTFQSTTMTKQKKIITRIVSGAWISLLLCFFFRYDISFTIIPQYVHFQCNNIVNFFQKCLISPHQNFFFNKQNEAVFPQYQRNHKRSFPIWRVKSIGAQKNPAGYRGGTKLQKNVRYFF